MWKRPFRSEWRHLKSRERKVLLDKFEEKEKDTMKNYYYIVESIDGDYANLKRTDIETDEVKLVARALLPDGIDVGTQLKYEMFEYEVM